MKKIKLSKNQREYLYTTLSLDDNVLFETLKIGALDELVFNLSESTIDQIRDWAINKQQKSGFDEQYKPTVEGLLLDNIIDTFFI